MDMNGGNLVALTEPMLEQPRRPQITPDGAWVICELQSGFANKIAKIPILGGKPVVLFAEAARAPAVSPDGKWVACTFFQSEDDSTASIALLPLAGGEARVIGQMPHEARDDVLRWTADGKAITYIVDKQGTSNIGAQPVDGGIARQLTNFKAEDKLYIMAFDWSNDGTLVVSRGQWDGDVVLIKEMRQE